jgi:hypothetical protein
MNSGMSFGYWRNDRDLPSFRDRFGGVANTRYAGIPTVNQKQSNPRKLRLWGSIWGLIWPGLLTENSETSAPRLPAPH